MKKRIIHRLILGLILCGLTFTHTVFAAAQPISGIDISAKKNGGRIPNELNPGESDNTADVATITTTDLDVIDVGTLPTSSFYFLKKWNRGLNRFFSFTPLSRARLELNISNQIAAEVLAVKKASPDNDKAIKKAIENYTTSQTKLNFELTQLAKNPTKKSLDDTVQITELTKKVEKDTVKQIIALEQSIAKHSDTETSTSISQDEYTVLRKNIEDATRKTLGIAFEESLSKEAITAEQKATYQIIQATEAIKKAEMSFGQAVTLTATIRPVLDVDENGQDAIVSEPLTDGLLIIRYISKAKSQLEDAKTAFAEGEYGKSYGLARSVEAKVSLIQLDTEDSKKDTAEKRKIPTVNEPITKKSEQAPDTSKKKALPRIPMLDSIKESFNISDNESPRPTNRDQTTSKITPPEEKKESITQPSSNTPSSTSTSDSTETRTSTDTSVKTTTPTTTSTTGL